MRPVLIAIALMIVCAPAFAGDAQPAQAKPATRIEADDKAGVIRFIVKGKEAARLDGAGLHVRESVEYGGTATDTGEAAYGGSAPAKAAR